eukprot:5070605-Amphidinium_carterae.1
MLGFSDLVSGASPSPADLLDSMDMPDEFIDGMTVHLVLGENMSLSVQMSSFTDGDNEIYASATED